MKVENRNILSDMSRLHVRQVFYKNYKDHMVKDCKDRMVEDNRLLMEKKKFNRTQRENVRN